MGVTVQMTYFLHWRVIATDPLLFNAKTFFKKTWCSLFTTGLTLMKKTFFFAAMQHKGMGQPHLSADIPEGCPSCVLEAHVNLLPFHIFQTCSRHTVVPGVISHSDTF